MIWDFKKKDKIEYFDIECSYELTGYKPITETKGLDFNPDWFREAAIRKETTGRFCPYVRNSKKWLDWWKQEKQWSIEGRTINGYRLTGDNYFFLNYYPMMVVREINGKKIRIPQGFPDFINVQYEYFHYIELCEILGKDVCALKSRAVGFSHISASLGLSKYLFQRGSKSIYTAFAEINLNSDGVITKVWEAMDYLDQETETAFKRLRQKVNQDLHRRASKVDKQGNEISDSWMAEIIGRIVDKPRKLRGARVDRLFFEEAGSYKDLTTAYNRGKALVEVLGEKFGTRFVWGTGGDEGPYMEGIVKMFYNPTIYNILPFKNQYNSKKNIVYTSYFVPAYRLVTSVMDKRGVTPESKGRAYYEIERENLKNKPKELLELVSEYCFDPEEALSQQGDNKFNQEKLQGQKARLSTDKDVPKPKRGFLDWQYVGNTKRVKGVEFREDPSGDIFVLEEPVKNNGKSYENLYVAGIDSIDQGVENSVVGEDGSDFAIVVKKRTFGLTGDCYVCYYRDRPSDERIAYETSIKILYYYNCSANLEDTKRTIISYYREKGQFWRLIKRPSIASNSVDGKKRSNLIGTPSSTKMIQHGLNLVGQYVEDFSQNIYFPEFLDELLNYSYEKKSKFDLVAAMQMTEVYDEELSDTSPIVQDSIDDEWQDIGYYYDTDGIMKHGVLPKQKSIEDFIEKSNGPIKFIDKVSNEVIYEW